MFSSLSPNPNEMSLRFGHFELVPAERVLRVHGQPVAVGSRAFDVLLVLAQRHERLVTKQELLDLVWPGLVVEENNIATQISNLRRLLGTQTIATLPGYGYRLTAARHVAPAADAATPPPASADQPQHDLPHHDLPHHDLPHRDLAHHDLPHHDLPHHNLPHHDLPHHNLPDSRTRFIGREAALADLTRLLPSTRLLTMTGIGGCGKTRLALQFAQSRLAAFVDGVWFVDLAPLNDADRVASACAAVFGIREAADAPLLQRLSAHLAQRRTLLLLDNCEHVIDGVAALVDALLADTAATILATSREGLGVAGEQIYPVRSLLLPAATDAAAVRAAEAVRVFVDRARLVLPDFDVDDGNAAPLAEICTRLDGIALAIELAAARVPMLSVAEIAARLDDRFRLFTRTPTLAAPQGGESALGTARRRTGGGRTLARHQTLSAAMQWSYELLAPTEQRLLRQMAVFAGGWTLQAAAEVASIADEYDALALLTALHDKSLLVVERADADAGAAPRYRMLETVRQYALERLNECGEAEAARERHAAHYVAWAEAAEPHVRGPDQDVWIARFRHEHENLVAALEWCCQASGDAQAGLRLATASTFYWLWNGVELGHRLACAVLEHDRTAADTSARVGTLRSISKLSLFRGRYAEALAFAQQALEVARRVGEPRTSMMALDELGSALNTAGRIDEALRAHEEALAYARALGDASMLPYLLNSIAESRRSAGELGEAERCYREALEIARSHGGRLVRIVPLNNLIRVLVAQGRLDHAQGVARECWPLVRDQKVGVDLLEASVGLASCLGEHARAARFWGAADQTLKAWGYRHQPVDVEHTAPLLEESRSALGVAAFDAAEIEGRALAFEQAMFELGQWLEGRSGKR